jgi:sulfatase modifying factor 1
LLKAQRPARFGFRLPTEAQWEYACRAGAETALYTGGITIKGENHAPELDAIAWYGGNSGRELEVKNPRDSKGYPNKQHDDVGAGTHRVKLKHPNGWGLYDMLGNIWEWCSDAWSGTAYQERKTGVIDPMQTASDASADRVIRGGSWVDLARSCRAAYRFVDGPGDRWSIQGLRLSAGQEPGEAEPLRVERPSVPERRSRG